MNQVLPHEIRELIERLPRWWPWLVDSGVRWANHGPRWIPLVVRKVPLNLACWIGSIYARTAA